jgi:hypothetical protein
VIVGVALGIVVAGHVALRAALYFYLHVHDYFEHARVQREEAQERIFSRAYARPKGRVAR